MQLLEHSFGGSHSRKTHGYAEEKIKKEIDVKSVRVLIENDLQDYLKYRAHLWLDEQIRFMIQDDPKKGTV